jgi:hypothetical protein
MPLNVLQLSQVKPWRRRGERAIECFLGGMIGAMGALIIMWALTS